MSKALKTRIDRLESNYRPPTDTTPVLRLISIDGKLSTYDDQPIDESELPENVTIIIREVI
jgi:hypothetical protein